MGAYVISLVLSRSGPYQNNIRLMIEPLHEKTFFGGFQPGLTKTGLYSHRRWPRLEILDFGRRETLISM